MQLLTIASSVKALKLEMIQYKGHVEKAPYGIF